MGRGKTHPLADGHSFFGHGLGVGHIVLHNGLKELVLILTVKWRLIEDKRQEVINRRQHRRTRDRKSLTGDSIGGQELSENKTYSRLSF